jgi:hypothetical protein
MATSPAALPGIPYGGFSPVRLQAPGTTRFSDKPSRQGQRLKFDPNVPRRAKRFARAFEMASTERLIRLKVRDLGFDRPTWAQRSSLG